MCYPRIILFLLCALVCVWLSVANAATSPGFAILNKAFLTYIDTYTGEPVEVESNIAEITVARLYRFSLTDDQQLEAYPGQELRLAHTLINTGNTPDEYDLQLVNLLDDQGDLFNLQLTVDSDENGLVDDGEPTVDAAISLDPGESVVVLISGTTPPDIQSGDVIELSLSATSAQDAQQHEPTVNVDTITTVQPALLNLDLIQGPECRAALSAGDSISYQLDISNSSNQLPIERQILVDGLLQRGVLVQMPVPDGLTLQSGSTIDNQGYESTVLVQQSAGNDDEWISHALWDSEVSIRQLAVLYPAYLFEQDKVITLLFDYTVRAVAAEDSTVFEVSASIDVDADRSVDFQSNTVCSQAIQLAAANQPALRFVSPASERGDWADTVLYRLDTGDLPSPAYEVDRDGVYLELTASIAEQLSLTTPDGVRHTNVLLRSSSTDDTVIVLMRETAVGSGVYRSVRPVRLSESISGAGGWCPDSAIDSLTGSIQVLDHATSCVLRSVADDKLLAEFVDPFNSVELTDAVSVHPSSRVFDSSSLLPVAGVTVTLFSNSQIATDPVTGEPLVFITDPQGRFYIPPLPLNETFYISVDAPEPYSFPSQVMPAQFVEYAVSASSYGEGGFQGQGNGQFSVTGESEPLVIDIPLDPREPESLLSVSKRALNETVDVGGSVQYEIVISNQGKGDLDNVMIIDTPAYGFRLLEKTSRLDQVSLEDPRRLRLGTDYSGVAAGMESEVLSGAYLFDIGRLSAGQQRVLRYQLLASPAALHSNGINTAVASAQTASGLSVSSLPSRVAVEVVRSGVLSESAILFGKVYVDSTCDGIHNRSEWPIGGVKLFLQDGSFVITDEDGQYSLYGLQPGLHIVKVDPLTLPEGLKLKPLDNRNAADGGSRFVELSEGDFHRADFATGCPEVDVDGVLERLKQRNDDLRGSWLIDEASLFNPDGKARILNERQRASGDGDLSSGFISESRTLDMPSAPVSLEADVLPAGGELSSSEDRVANAAARKMISATEQAALITTAQADNGTWLWPESEFSVDGRFSAVIRTGTSPQLIVNDEAVSSSQIGERVANRRERAELVTWYGVQLKPGPNDIKVTGTDSFGNERVLAEGVFKRPAAGVSMQLRTRQDTLPADGGRTLLPIDIVINDINGYPANGVYFVTLTTTGGDFLEQDLQSSEPGVQVRINNGRGKIHVRSSELAGRLKVTAKSGNMRTAIDLVQVAAARPLIGVGLVELGGRWSSLSTQDDRVTLASGFDTTARAAVFLKGRVKNDMKLTLSYDTDKDKDTELLRDINPNEHYPTFGDASSKGFEAQSRSKLYAKLERDKSSIMWGDYLTDARSELDNLARVQRTLTGFNAVHETDSHLLQFFAASVSDVRASEEVRGNGTAMLFRLAGAPLVANSEVIEIVVRDRDNPGLIISSERLLRVTDYTLDSVNGLLSFRDVVPSVDADLNLVFVRASYDKATNLDDYLVAGLRWQFNLTDQWKTGFTFTEDQNPLSGYKISGLYGSGLLGAHTAVSVSAATMSHVDNTGRGYAQRIRIEHLWQGSRDHRTVMSWSRANETFTHADSGVSTGRQEWQLEHQQPLTESVDATLKSTLSESTTDATHYGTAGLNLTRRFGRWTANGGLRRIWSSEVNQSLSFNTILMGAERRFRLPGGRTLSLGLDAERGLSDASRFRYGLDSRIQVFDHASLYMRYEREQKLSQQSLSGSQQGSRQWILGVESDVLPSTQLYSEYRMRGSFNGRSIETASGVRGRYQLREGVSLSPSFEFIDVLRSNGAEDSVAVSLGITDTSQANRKLTAQAELRDSAGSRYYGFRASLAQRLNLDWTTLVREEFTRQSPNIGQVLSRHQFTLGLARRPKLSNEHHALFMGHWREEYGPDDGQDRRTLIVSTHHNRQLGQGFALSGRAGMKWQSTRFEAGDVSSRVQLLDMRLSKDLNRRWEVDLRSGWLGVEGNAGNRHSLGAGVSWIVDRNLRLGLAYNITGFSETDLDAQGFNRQGVHLGLQFKFDEDWFQWLSD